ncbi:pseudouridine synthase [Sphingobacterium sp. WM]|uniref:pseudouridine synthase n=1 Tax=Sphingobacterium sp. WM TaxID=3031802 RepID=UPI00240CE65C|nr:pseudouridine synthase [Sphingobacterium sp. WM]WFB65412.1 pseudouridine synthase [Sphingobacterium sp. WM]
MPFNSKRNSREDNSRKSRSNSDGFKNNKKDDKSSFDSSRSYKSDKFNRDSNSDKGRFDKDAKFGRDSKFNKDSKFARDSKFNKDSRPDRDSKFGRDSKFDRNSKFGKDSRPDRDSKFSRDSRPDRDSRFNREDRDSKFNREERFNKEDRFNREERPERKSRYGEEATKRSSKFSKDSKFNKDGKFEKSFNSDRPYKKFDGKGRDFSKRNSDRDNEGRSDKDFRKDNFRKPKQEKNFNVEDDGLIRLNRYISNSGICSRRKADELIEAGVISVNGEVVTELGTKVDPAKDEIRYNNERLKREKMVYILLNKPKDYITTTDDPQERKTVMHLVAKATKERIYPVGRLDRNTTGLLLLTNDGNLAEKLSHPRNNISKIYQVELNKNLSQGDFNKIQFGIELEDGFIKPDDVSFVVGASKREVGIQIHSGKNRIVRRIFESLGYEVEKLDRVVYANLTKKDLPRGRWRYLEEKEIIQLKHLMK